MAISNTTSLIDLHRKFWEHRLDKPIINLDCSLTQHFRHISALPPQWADRDGLLLEPDMISPEELQQAPIQIDNPLDPIAGQVALNTLFPYPRLPWLVGIMGCGLLVSTAAETVWPVHSLGEDWFTKPDLDFHPQMAWLDKLLEFVHYICTQYYPLRAIPAQDIVVRGPGDLCVNMMGTERFYLSLFDHPDEVKHLLSSITDLYINWAESQLEIIPKINGGYVNQYGIWCPGTCVRFQEDYAINLSPKLFREFIFPHSQRVVEAFDFSIIHTHSGDPHLAEIMLGLDPLKAIEVSLDPNGPSLEKLIPLWNRILEKKCLIIAGPVTPSQLELLSTRLSPRGLWLDLELINEKQQGAWEWDQSGTINRNT